MLTPENLKAIRERCKAATDGPWEAGLSPVEGEGHIVSCSSEPVALVGWNTADATFVAHAREDVPRLLDEVERLREQFQALRTLFQKRETDEKNAYIEHHYLRQTVLHACDHALGKEVIEFGAGVEGGFAEEPKP